MPRSVRIYYEQQKKERLNKELLEDLKENYPEKLKLIENLENSMSEISQVLNI